MIFQIDTSPPGAGAFAVETNHAADLDRHRDGWMTYVADDLHLAWLGFSDPQTEVLYYYVTVGTAYGRNDLIGVRSIICILIF